MGTQRAVMPGFTFRDARGERVRVCLRYVPVVQAAHLSPEPLWPVAHPQCETLAASIFREVPTKHFPCNEVTPGLRNSGLG